MTQYIVSVQGNGTRKDLTMQLQDLVDGKTRTFSPALIAGALRTTKAEIADTLGLSRDALSRTTRINAAKTQTRLREMVEILHRVEDYTGSPPLVAYAWFRSEALPGFGGMTADQLVREGNAAHVHAYLDHVMAGGYA